MTYSITFKWLTAAIITLCVYLTFSASLVCAETSTGSFAGMREAGGGDIDFLIKDSKGSEEAFVIASASYQTYKSWEQKENLGKMVKVHWTNAGTAPYTFKVLNSVEMVRGASASSDVVVPAAPAGQPEPATEQQKTQVDRQPAAQQSNVEKQITPSQKSSGGSSITTILIWLAVIGVIGVLIYFFGAMKAIGWLIFLIGVFLKATFIQNIGRKMKGGESGEGRSMTSLLARPECEGRTSSDSLCGKGLLQCPKCGNVGCNYSEEFRCSNQAFKSNKCMGCGAYVSEAKNWVPG